MIAGLEGILDGLGNDFIILRVGGVSFRVFVPSPASSGSIGERIRLHTSLQFKENYIAIYGFSSQEELELFDMLISVSGVGPKVALAMLATMSFEQLSLAIASGDIEILTQAPGVGKKVASRLVLELKGKLERWQLSASVSPEATVSSEVLAALKSLGYTTTEAMAAMAAIPDSSELTIEDKIKISLQYLGKA